MIKKTPSGSCPVEDGENCAMPDRRNKIYFDYGVNVPTVIAFVMMLGAGIGWLLRVENRQTNAEGQIKQEAAVRAAADKGIIDHAQALEQVAVRDRLEMREDIKEIKALATTLVKRR